MSHQAASLVRTLARATAVAALLAPLAAPPAAAQIFDGGPPSEPPREEHEPWKGRGALDFIIARPVGGFGDVIDPGIGGSLYGVFPIDRRGIFGLRADADYIVYGSQSDWSYIYGIPIEVRTSNNIISLGAGAQLSAPSGPIRPYLHGGFGFAYFFTQSSLDSRYGDTYDSRTNYDDITFAWTGGGGLYIPVTGGQTPLSIDVGARYRANGRARYLREGSIQEDGSGGVTYQPVESETNYIVYHIGVSIGGGWGRE